MRVQKSANLFSSVAASLREASERCRAYSGVAHRATATEEIELRRAENVFDAANRNDDPGRAVVQFVTDFVDGFVEEISFEQDLEIVFIGRNEIGAVSGGEIAVEKDAAHLAIPKVGPTFEE